MSNLFQSTTIPVLEQVVHFAQARHNILAGNIANLDTPGYRVRDLSQTEFQTRLRRALDERRQGAAVTLGDPVRSQGEALEAVSRDFAGILFHDDSNGSLEAQITELAKNQVEHNLALAIMTNQFRLLQAAISERA